MIEATVCPQGRATTWSSTSLGDRSDHPGGIRPSGGGDEVTA
jgi:hypothetical protein